MRGQPRGYARTPLSPGAALQASREIPSALRELAEGERLCFLPTIVEIDEGACRRNVSAAFRKYVYERHRPNNLPVRFFTGGDGNQEYSSDMGGSIERETCNWHAPRLARNFLGSFYAQNQRVQLLQPAMCDAASSAGRAADHGGLRGRGEWA